MENRIIELAIKLSGTAVLGDLAYIIQRLERETLTYDDARFAAAVPEMLCHMLLCAVIITAFGALAAAVLDKE